MELLIAIIVLVLLAMLLYTCMEGFDFYPFDYSKSIIPSAKSVYMGPQNVFTGKPIKRTRLPAEAYLLGITSMDTENMIDIYSGNYDQDYIESPSLLGVQGPAGILRAGTIRYQPYYNSTGLGQSHVANSGKLRRYAFK